MIRANCPFCELAVQKTDRKQCLQLHLETGFWKCYRCDTRGKLEELPFDITTTGSVKPKTDEPVKVLLPQGFIPLWKPEGQKSLLAAPARKYLEGRGIDRETLEFARIGACVRGRFAGRVVVPIYKAGKLAGYVGRSLSKRADKKYLYTEGFQRAEVLYNEDALYVTTDVPVLVVEGVFDTFPFYPDAVALLGKPSGQQVEMLCNARRPIAIVLDGDAWREAAALAMALRLEGKNAIDVKLPPGVDPDERPQEVWDSVKAALAAA